MKKILWGALMAAMMLAVGCANDNLESVKIGAYKLNATVESDAGSKAGIYMNDGAFFWNNGDRIAVGEDLANYITECVNGVQTAVFSSDTAVQQGDYAVYPYSATKSIAGSILTYNLVNEYKYISVDRNFFDGMRVSIPMWAPVIDNVAEFKHLGGVIAFKIENLKAGENQTFTVTADKKIAGEFTVDLSAAEPILATAATDVAEEKSVVIKFSLKKNADAVFYVPVPVGTYDLTVEAKNGTDVISKSYTGLEVARRDIRYTTLAAVVTNTNDITNAMKDNNSVIVDEITADATDTTIEIELPVKDSEADAASEHTLTFNSIDENVKTIIISEEMAAGYSIEELVINVPSLDDAKSLEINMPETTVTIAVNGTGTLTFEEVVATTADNTLVVSDGITIKKLVVVAGNVKALAGSAIEAVERAVENESDVTYLYYADGTTLPTTLGAGVEACMMVSQDLAEVIAAAKNGTTVVLGGDIVVASTITIAQDKVVTLDMNGYNVNYAVDNNGTASSIFNNLGDLSIVNSAAQESVITFVASDPDLNAIPSYATNTITNEGTLTIGANVTVINESNGGASYAVDDKGVFTLNGGTLSATRCALRIAKFNQDDVQFTMNAGSTVKGATPAWVQLPGSNAAQAPKITVVINGGVMQSTKANPDEANVFYTYSYGNSHANTSITINGGEFLGGTVSIGSGYKGDVPSLTINGGTFDHDVVQWLENDDYKVLYEANK